MKIRTNFVTNSSSSSYVIAFKGFPKIDDETLRKYPFLEHYETVFRDMLYGDEGDYDTKETIECKNIESLQEAFLEQYSWNDHHTFQELYQEDEYVKEAYDLCVPYLEKGYIILMKDVGYDDNRNKFFKELESDDFVLILTGD